MLRSPFTFLLASFLFALACQPVAGTGVRGVQAAPAGQDASGQGLPFSAPPFDPGAVKVRLERTASGLREPTMVTPAGDGSGRLFVTERAGRIVIVESGQLRGSPYLDIRSLVGSSGQEQGLLSVAFHPRYVENGLFYINYIDLRGTTIIARYSVSSDQNAADPASASVLLRITQPAANHNGGLMVFGPDGYLWIGMGDGGGAGDQFRNAQNRQSLLGKLLRIDINSGESYGIPPDNPFINVPNVAPEIWAYGLRNPWRFSFDWPTGELYIADVGQNRYEWVHHQDAGARGGQNFGWPIMEGLHCYPSGNSCNTAGLDPPITEYGHDKGCSITGGFVYRGQAYPQVQGVYFFADFCSGRLWALDWSAAGGWRQTELANTGLSVSTFGQDEAGELYLATLDGGALYHLVFE